MDMDALLEEYKRQKLLLEEGTERMHKLCSKMSELMHKKEDDYKKMIETVAKYPKVKDEIVRFNVGGIQFATSKSNITKKIPLMGTTSSELEMLENVGKYYEPNMLEGLVSGLVEVELDKTGSIFVDRDSKHFDLLLEYLRCANTRTPFELGPKCTDQNALLKEARFYNLQGLVELLQPNLEIQSVILQQNSSEQRALNRLLNSIPSWRAQDSTLLYRATSHGFSAAAFHQQCNNAGRTLTIIKAANSNYVFGGYNTVAWDSSGTYKPDESAFLFSLVNKDNKPLVLSPDPQPQSTQSAIYTLASYGPTFGGGHDLYICNNANTTSGSYSNLGHSFKHPDLTIGSDKAQSLLAGSYNFTVSEIEVFQLS